MRACESCRTLPRLASPCPSVSCPRLPLAYVAVCCVGRCHAVAPCRVVQDARGAARAVRKEAERKRGDVGADIDWCTRLEIGAGGGLVGLAVANGCSLSQPLHITDQLEMLSLMGHNVFLNNAQGRVKPMVLNWCVQTSPVDYHSLPHIVDRYPRPSCLSATLATCSVTSSCPIVSRPSVANHGKNPTGASHCPRKR